MALPVPSLSAQRLDSFQRRAVSERIPLNGSIAITHRCNLRCVHCYLGNERWKREDSELDTAFWCDIIDQIAVAGCLNLLITGGEPLLRDDFIEIYSRSVSRGMLTVIFTNCTLVSQDIVRVFTTFPPRLVEITVYGASESVFDGITGVPGSFQRCLAGIDLLIAGGIRVGLKTMIMVENQHEIGAMRAMAQERGARFRVDPALFPRRDGHTGPLEHRIPAAQAVALEMVDEDFRQKAEQYYDQNHDAVPEDRLFSCLAGRTEFHIDSMGSLFPCMMMTTRGFDLHKGSFSTGWREAIPERVNRKIIPGFDCHVCEKRVICGLCPAQFELETGSVYQKAEYTCQLGSERSRVLTGEG